MSNTVFEAFSSEVAKSERAPIGMPSRKVKLWDEVLTASRWFFSRLKLQPVAYKTVYMPATLRSLWPQDVEPEGLGASLDSRNIVRMVEEIWALKSAGLEISAVRRINNESNLSELYNAPPAANRSAQEGQHDPRQGLSSSVKSWSGRANDEDRASWI